MSVVFDLVAFIVSFVMMGSVLARYKKVDTQFLLLSVAIMVSCMGRFILAISQSLETALLANRILYVGGCYAPLLLVVVLFKLSDIRLPKLAVLAMTLYSSIVMLLVMTTGYFDLYYKEVELVITDGYSHLTKVYGPLHILYPIMMAFYGVILLIFLVCSPKMRNKISLRTVMGLSVIGCSVILAYAIERALDSAISLVSLSYLVAMVFLIRYFDRLNMYDMSANVLSALEHRGGYGYVVFDTKCRYISSNRYIKEIFPEIGEWIVDKRVPPSDSMLYTEAVQYFLRMKWEDIDKKVISAEGKFFELDIRPIFHGKKKAGYLIEFVDRTIERKYFNSIENYNAVLQQEVEAKTANIMHIKDMMVLGMADMVESRDSSTGGHIKRTSAVVRVFSERLGERCGDFGFDGHFLRQVEKAAPMHDLGKIAIADSILQKPAKLTADEYSEMKRHTVEGAKIVENILRDVEDDEFVQIAKNVALYHHERWDGGGYPMGIAGEAIPVEARIMALADVFDALVSGRCYKEDFSCDEAFAVIEQDLGAHFDPELGRIFLQCRPELEQIYNN